jgi:hypothetical protein
LPGSAARKPTVSRCMQTRGRMAALGASTP